jgi:hypothetical protein
MFGTFQERSVIFLVISMGNGRYLQRLKSDSVWTQRPKKILFKQVTIAIPLNQDCVSLLWHQRKSHIQEKSRVNNQCLTHKMNKQSKRNPNIYLTESEKKTMDTLLGSNGQSWHLRRAIWFWNPQICVCESSGYSRELSARFAFIKIWKWTAAEKQALACTTSNAEKWL